jgi:altronate dehydratase small subunit
MMTKLRAILMKQDDNVCTVIETIEPGADIDIDINGDRTTVQVCERIPFAHKFAFRPIRQGEAIVKYGEVIGIATKDIRPGQHVHIHNLESRRGRGDK